MGNGFANRFLSSTDVAVLFTRSRRRVSFLTLTHSKIDTDKANADGAVMDDTDSWAEGRFPINNTKHNNHFCILGLH
jgi:hypothetical protein